ncbi:pyridoxamine 5'-phosphate oxidase family protein [Mycobacterium sp.]|uniref:pyridoxamine 5'-phosphate oxidase family protein n=1 Tax=Mycobacterium sp. TaxID=1785 RepID=UPI0039C94F1F
MGEHRPRRRTPDPSCGVRSRPRYRCIEIGGPRLHETHKVRNIRRDPRVSLVVDEPGPEPVGPGQQGGRGIEIRGAAALSQRRQPLAPGFGTDIIRITPARIVAWNLDRPGYNSRFVP